MAPGRIGLMARQGKVHPFSTNDNGADLVETSYMVEGLITMRQYLNPATPAELTLIDRIDALNHAVEYDWFTRGQNVLYWHWSPNLGWIMNMPIRGYNETLITLCRSGNFDHPPDHSSSLSAGICPERRNKERKQFTMVTGFRLANLMEGPLFFTHYSFLGLEVPEPSVINMPTIGSRMSINL